MVHLVRDEGVAGSNPATPTSTWPESLFSLARGSAPGTDRRQIADKNPLVSYSCREY